MDTWKVGEAYEPYVGRWSRPVARDFVQWIDVAPRARFIDVGCGTGALTETLLHREPTSILAVDASEGFVECARRNIDDARVRIEVADARSLPSEDGAFDAAVSGLVLNFVPTPEKMVAEMARVVRDGGHVAVYVWDYAGEMQLMRRFWDAAITLDPKAAELDEGNRFPICHPDALAELWRGAGLASVETKAIDVPTSFRNFDDYWQPFLGGQGPAPSYAMALEPANRAALRERLRATLPTTSDGRIDLIARAWAIKGRREDRSPTGRDSPRQP